MTVVTACDRVCFSVVHDLRSSPPSCGCGWVGVSQMEELRKPFEREGLFFLTCFFFGDLFFFWVLSLGASSNFY